MKVEPVRMACGHVNVPLLMEKNIEPDHCSSLHCEKVGCDYCKECSHAYFFGEVESNGRNHKFEFNPRFGVTFLKADGGHRAVQPTESNPVWAEWEKWHKDKFERK